MLNKLFSRFSRNQILLKKYRAIVAKINKLEAQFSDLDRDELAAYSGSLRERALSGENVNNILPEAFALTREAAKRVMGMRHFDVQLIGGMALHNGKVAEMATGEGKTLVATLAAYLNALSGKGVHLVTVNDYLAKRDAEWMRPLYEFLGLSLGVVVAGMSAQEKKEAYQCDICYGTNNELGFDYLRDNMALSIEDRVQRPLNFAIIDEADSILIDEARTPLIISGHSDDEVDLYRQLNSIIPLLQSQAGKEEPGDYWLDEKAKQVILSDDGFAKVEQILQDRGLLIQGGDLYSSQGLNLLYHLSACLKAHAIFKKDVDYIIMDGKVLIVDEHTGRVMSGRRWSDGLHQAIEAKEFVQIEQENQTLASITFQNFFRLYDKLSGMTGTADTEAYELNQIYGLEVAVIPANRPCQRIDAPDKIYLTQEQKYKAIIKDTKEAIEKEQPVLLGTGSIASSEHLSSLLQLEHIKHKVLNAKHHEREAEIISEAGRPGAVTIATNMAGRGTDIVLGGVKPKYQENSTEDLSISDEQIKEVYERELAAWQQRHQQVLAAGGLRVIACERHESRRIDNQLRGRSGRQGDNGSSQFYLSIRDDLLRIFISPRIAALLDKLGMNDNEAITNNWISNAVENAQRKVEGHNFDIRKQLLEFDDVANEQRKIIYKYRSDILEKGHIQEEIQSLLRRAAHKTADQDSANLAEHYGISIEKIDPELIWKAFNAKYQEQIELIGREAMDKLEQQFLLSVLDRHWREHLSTQDYLRQSMHLRGYAQKDPKQEYKKESFILFKEMLENIDLEVASSLLKVDLNEFNQAPKQEDLAYEHEQLNFEQETKFVEVGRNHSCPCGSGIKYKQCHGKLDKV